MPVFAITIFLSAFLLFAVQLLLGKYLLPWFGGAPAVWTTCMLFFQVMLLGGYTYAHWLARRPSVRLQRNVHLALLAAALALLAATANEWGTPLLPDGSWKPAGDDTPVTLIVLLLAVAVGLPYFLLAATNPLVQAWFNRARPGASPYRLYALSNLGSLLGLVSYPFVVEVLVPLHMQAASWAAIFVVFAGCIAATAFLAARAPVAKPAPAQAGGRDAAPARRDTLLWMALAACASVLLLAVTNQMTQEVAAVPFLWMLPLALYLLSFILCFESDRWYSRPLYGLALIVLMAATPLLLQHDLSVPITGQIGIWSATLFVACMVCHGELARLKPGARHLTGYYLAITAGGAAGGVLVAIGAPYLFLDYWELPLSLWMCVALFAFTVYRDRSAARAVNTALARSALLAALTATIFVFAEQFGEGSTLTLRSRAGIGTAALLGGTVLMLSWMAIRALPLPIGMRRWFGPVLPATRLGTRAQHTQMVVAALLLFATAHFTLLVEPLRGALHVSRNFYGVLHVDAHHPDEPARHYLKLRHGRITHGLQYQDPEWRNRPNTYYGPASGIATAFTQHPRRARAFARALKVGIIGLGTGTLAAFGDTGDQFRFYEINPQVTALAAGERAMFSYLDNSAALIELVPGDARLALERELARDGSAGFHLLVADAFSSDSIPVHLVTREAFALYTAHLDPEDGILAVHVSNRYIELAPVVHRLAREFGLDYLRIDTSHPSEREWSSNWILLAPGRALAGLVPSAEAAVFRREGAAPLWTDDYSNLLGALRLSADPETAGLSALDGCFPADCADADTVYGR